MSSKMYVGFTDGASRHTCNLASAAWVIYSPLGQLVAAGGACLGPASNNVAEYRAVIVLPWLGPFVHEYPSYMPMSSFGTHAASISGSGVSS